jgi:anthraniloyl-CoA monooxygenase
MKIVSVGGGPGGLYFAILMKRAHPECAITVHERNRADDTFGFGVVFSDETLGGFAQADPESFAQITKHFAYWGDIETYVGDTCVKSTGHGFCGLSRMKLLQIFHERCRQLGVDLRFGSEIKTLADVAADAGPADLVLAADGLNSALRTELETHFRPTIEWGRARFCWLGARRQLGAFTFVFKESRHGLFQLHAYPYETGMSTFIVECDESTWRAAGLDHATESDTVAFCSDLFAEHLQGAELVTNRSLWRSFPTVRNERWHHGNLVLIGDAAHTAHFSIGSGTKLAMEDAIALAAAFERHAARGGRAAGAAGGGSSGGGSGGGAPQWDVPAVLADYQESRYVDCLKIQKAARVSQDWFENSSRYLKQHPLQFTFNLLTRSKKITWENLRQRDPALVDRVDRWFAEQAAVHAAPPGAPLHPAYGTRKAQGWDEKPAVAAAAAAGAGAKPAAGTEGAPTVAASANPVGERSIEDIPDADKAAPALAAPPPLFAPLRLRGLQLANRVVVSPMCQYSAAGGVPGDWHLVHLGARAVGGAGLVLCEMTDVLPDGRITLGCTGLWNEAQQIAWARIVDFVHANSGAAIGIQLAHAGRKGSCTLPWEGGEPLRDARAWTTFAPSAEPFAPGWPAPRAMDRADMDAVREAFVAAARRADRAGFDLIELHMAHGYLLSSFISPLSNLRTDEYGGALEHRLRFPLEVFEAVRDAWPAAKPMSVRISATDWLDDEGGLTAADSVLVARALRERGLDVLDVSSAGNSPRSKPVYGRMYQVPLADRIRHEVGGGLAVMAVGAIQGRDHVNTILAAGRADLCALARPHLVDPHVVLGASAAYDYIAQPWPKQYLPAKPKPK